MDVGNIKRCGNALGRFVSTESRICLIVRTGWCGYCNSKLSGVALVQLYKHNETFRNAVNNAWESIKSGTVAAVEAMKSAIDSLGSYLGTIPENFQQWVQQSVQH